MTEHPMEGRIRGLAAKLAEAVLAPTLEEDDKEERFRREAFGDLAAKGITALPFPKEQGGLGLPATIFLAALEEIAVVDPGMAVVLSVHSGLGGGVIARHGQDEARANWLPRLASGEALCAYALTESEAGSDPASMRTTAKKDGEDWILDGEKMWITSGSVADCLVVYAVAEEGPVAFIVPRGSEGLSVEKITGKLGIRTSDTSAVVLDGVRVHDSLRLGDPGRGLALALEALDHGRLGIAAISVGLQRAALDNAVRYAGERRQFGKPIAGHQLIQEMLADMATDLEAARLLLADAAAKREEGERFTKEAAVAKLFASEAAFRAADRCLQVHGGYGYSNEFPAERFLRDARILTLFEGTSEVQRLLIGRLVTGQDAFR